jgi:hypothetical protein
MWTAAMAETDFYQKAGSGAAGGAALARLLPLIEKFGNLQSGWQGTECYSIN